MEPITLTTERLRLRTFARTDAKAVFAACQDPDIQRWTLVPSPYLRSHAEGFVGHLVPNGWFNGTVFTFAVCLPDSGELVASTAVTRRGEMGTWEVGFWTAKEYRGRGYMTEAVRRLARWTFEELGAVRLEWRAEVGNEGSRAVAEKAGFAMEGTLRGALLRGAGARDAWIGSLLPTDLGLPGTYPYLPADRA
ncbi:GNAT family N-acetyltransferase [Streptomyces sp. NPDC000410]|uniref:GNAT family N-acetyltransferase n=1 Tax=Streptomyces sp. NPDC000410 TaxID=3154254 RepID=UPI00332ABA61